MNLGVINVLFSLGQTSSLDFHCVTICTLGCVMFDCMYLYIKFLSFTTKKCNLISRNLYKVLHRFEKNNFDIVFFFYIPSSCIAF